ncbi:MAG: urate hydroxylase PuuD, partial [Armatimonadetes bacterium]|nr:urate hydroxylase PuuD [Armatimonadota bacterium]
MELWQEWLGLLLRWIHVIAAITWIGDSLLFMWIDRNLRDDPQRKEGVTGVTWMIHGGGYYTLEKRLLEPGKLPPYLRWFWLEATTTWISGFLLVIVVYYMSAGAMMVDPAVSKISTVAAVHLGIFLLPVAWLIYDGLWRTPLRHHTLIAVAISFALFMGVTWGLLHLLSPRAAYLHLGAMLA